MQPAVLATHEWLPHGTGHSRPTPTVVLVHGITGWWRTWWRVGPALAERGWRVVAVDLRGHGASPRIDGVITRADMAVDVALTVDQLGMAPVEAVIGHSLGAAVVMELAHARPELARCLVLEDPPGSDRHDDRSWQERFRSEVLAARSRPEAEIARLLTENPSWLEEDARHDVEGAQACDLDGITESIRHGMGQRVAELAPELAVPTLYLLAHEERSALQGDPRRRLLTGIPRGSRALELASGHSIHRDRFDDYLATVLAWLDEGGRA